jgi:hypothetical protein
MTGVTYIVKGRRPAERIASTANKLCNLMEIAPQWVCEDSIEFFKSHHIDKNKIHFCWNATAIQKMDILRKLFKSKDAYAK